MPQRQAKAVIIKLSRGKIVVDLGAFQSGLSLSDQCQVKHPVDQGTRISFPHAEANRNRDLRTTERRGRSSAVLATSSREVLWRSGRCGRPIQYSSEKATLPRLQCQS